MTSSLIVMAPSESLFWNILRRFEAHALARYRETAPMVVSSDKRAFVARLEDLWAPPAPADLDAEASAFLCALSSGDRRAALINQAFLLELVGHAIYTHVGAAKVSEETRALCAMGAAASAATRDKAIAELRAEYGDGDAFFGALIKTSPELLKKLAPFGAALERHFGESLGFSLADVIGEFVDAVDAAAGALGADRRKLVGFLSAMIMEM